MEPRAPRIDGQLRVIHAETSEGLRLLVDERRAEAAEWRRFSSSRTADTRAALFARYKGLAQKLGRQEHYRLADGGLGLDDCQQLAYEALLQSIDRFDPGYNVPFPAFARPRMRGAIRNAIAKATEARAASTARQRTERDRLASLKRKAEAAGNSDPLQALRELVVGMALGFMLDSDAQIEAQSVPTDAPSAYDNAAWNQVVQAMKDKLATLPEKERQVLDYHYQQGLRFTEIASLLGLSRSRISQIHAQGLARLRKSLAKFR